MSVQRIGGKDVRAYVGDAEIIASKIIMKIDDKREVAYTRGVANGFVDGECTADGSMTLDSQQFSQLKDVLLSGVSSWKEIPPQDIHLFASAGSLSKDLKAFGCLLKISDLWDSEDTGGKKTEHVIPFQVTSPDFVHIDDVPYLSLNEVRGIF